MVLSVARFVVTTSAHPNGGNWNSNIRAYFDATRKASPLITHVITGTGNSMVSDFTILAGGQWRISTGCKFAANSSCYITKGGIANGNTIAAMGEVSMPFATTCQGLSNGEVIAIRWTMSGGFSTTLDISLGEINFVSFEYLGPI